MACGMWSYAVSRSPCWHNEHESVKHADPWGFAYAEPIEFSRDVVRKFWPLNGGADEQFSFWNQWLELNGAGAAQNEPSYIVSPALEMRASEMGDSVSINASASTTRKPSKGKRGPGRPKKRGRPRKPKPDGRLAVASGPLTAGERRDIIDAVDYSAYLDRELNTPIEIHPAFLDTYPAGELRDWFRTGPWRAVGEFFARRKDEAGRPLGWYAFATRENYEGERREHLHVVCHCPDCHREALEKMLRRRFPGEERAIKVGTVKGEWLAYRMKQSAPNAMGPPRPGRATPEVRSRHDGALVAPVHGKRYMVSRSIDLAARTHAGWQEGREAWRAARRDHFRARRREEQDREAMAV